MSVDFNSMPSTEPGLGESDTPMFAGVPSWERNRKRRSFGGKARSAAPVVPDEPVATRNAAYVEAEDEAIATAPVYTTRTVKKSGSGLAPLAIAAGIVAVGALAAAGWYATQPHETGMAHLTPGTESVAPPAATLPQVADNTAPMPGEPAAAPEPTPAKAATPPARVTTRVAAAAAPARARPARSDSAEDAGVNTSATLPAAPQPYSGAGVAPTTPPDIAPPVAAAPQPVNPTPPATEAAPQVTPPAAATPPVQTPPPTT